MASKQKQKPDLVLDGEMPRGYRCPRCGSVEWSPGSYHYEPGWAEVTYTCWHQVRGRDCGFKVMERERVPSLIWVSPNNNWLIYEEDLPRAPDFDNDYSTVARVSVSDGYTSGTMDINVKGLIQYDQNVLYGSPQYVRDKAESILNKKWKGMVQPSKKANRNGKAKRIQRDGKVYTDIETWKSDELLWASKDDRWMIFKGGDYGRPGHKGIVASVKVRTEDFFTVISIDDYGRIQQWGTRRDIPKYVISQVERILKEMYNGRTPVYSENRRRGNGPLGSRSTASVEEDVRRHVGDERFSHIQAFMADHPGYSLAELCYDEDNWYLFGEWERRKYGKKASKAVKPGKGSSGSKLPYDPDVLAGEMTMFMAAADPFEFADQYGDDLESAHRDTLRGISTVDGVQTALRVLDDMGKQPDRDLERMRKSLMQKLNLMRDTMGFYGSGNRRSRR